MIIGFGTLTACFLGVLIIMAVKLWTFVLYRLVPIVGVIYLLGLIPPAFANENPFTRWTPHMLVTIHTDKLVEAKVYPTRRHCMQAGESIMGAVNDTEDDSSLIGFVCEAEQPTQPVCKEKVRYCA